MGSVAPPPPHPHPAAGQASLEYVGLLALVATALAVAAPAAGLAGVPVAVAKVVRTGICIVGGDVCRASDAEAAGLHAVHGVGPPAGRRARGHGAVRRLGGDHQWLVAQRSDGSVVVTKLARDDAGVSGGLGFELGPLKAGLEGEAGLRVAAGVGWEFPDAATARRFLAAAHYGLSRATRHWPAAWRSGEAGLAVSGWAGLGAVATGEDGTSLGGPAVGIEVTAEAALGARIERDRTTIYLRAQTGGPRTTGLLKGLLAAGAAGPVVAEYTRDRSGPRELAFRVSARGRAPDEVVETVARLDLRDARQPRGRAAAAAPPRPVAAGGRRGPARRGPAGGPGGHRGAQRLCGRGRLALVRAGGSRRGRARPRGGLFEGRPAARGGERPDGRIARTRPGGLRRVTEPPVERISCASTQSVALYKEEAMEFIKRSEPIWLALVVLGALNWGIVGLFDTNVVSEILGTGTATDVVYVVIGLAGLFMIPRLLEELRMGTHRAHPTGA